MHLRIRLENRSSGTIFIEPESLLLIGSNLETFGPARSDPPMAAGVPSGATGSYDLTFPFPDDMSLFAPEIEGLNLRWLLRYDGGEAEVTSSFARELPGYSDPHNPNFHWSFGIGTTYMTCY